MAAYLLFSLPLVVLISGALRRAGDAALRAFSDTPLSMARAFASGAVVAIPALLILNAVRPALEGSYRLGRLYAEALLGGHLVPIAIAAAGYVALDLIPIPGWERRPSFAVGLAYLGGYFTVLSAADYLAARSDLTVHVLFLMPTLRIVVCCIYARAMERLVENPRRPGWITVAVMVSLPALLALEGVWTRLGRGGPAALLTAGLAALTLLGLSVRGTTPGRRS